MATNKTNDGKHLHINSAPREEEYDSFSYSKSELPKVIHYIRNQEEHHKKRTFIEEYEDLLNEFEIEYDEGVCV